MKNNHEAHLRTINSMLCELDESQEIEARPAIEAAIREMDRRLSTESNRQILGYAVSDRIKKIKQQPTSKKPSAYKIKQIKEEGLITLEEKLIEIEVPQEIIDNIIGYIEKIFV